MSPACWTSKIFPGIRASGDLYDWPPQKTATAQPQRRRNATDAASPLRRSVFRGERRNSGANSLSPKTEASDTKLVPTRLLPLKQEMKHNRERYLFTKDTSPFPRCESVTAEPESPRQTFFTIPPKNVAECLTFNPFFAIFNKFLSDNFFARSELCATRADTYEGERTT